VGQPDTAVRQTDLSGQPYAALQGTTDHVATDHVATDHVPTDHVATDHVVEAADAQRPRDAERRRATTQSQRRDLNSRPHDYESCALTS
jgi:hypothetical protein